MIKAISTCIMVSFLSFITAGLVSANQNDQLPVLSGDKDKCTVIPKEDNCKGLFHVFYFDAAAGKCKEAWGCYGSVFNNMEECQQLCEKAEDVKPTEASPSEALLLYINQGNGDPKIVKGFIEYGADVNYSDEEYHLTPLHNASHYGHIDAVTLLLEHGSDVNAKNIEGNIPLYAAVHQHHLAITRILIERGSDVNAKNKFGYTPLRAASRKGNVEILKMLIEKGADVNVKDSQGNSPLHVALDEGNTEIINVLVNNGADINTINSHGGSPLHVAVAFGFVDIVKMLIEKGADLNARDRRGNTPLDLAEQRGYADIIEILITYKSGKI